MNYAQNQERQIVHALSNITVPRKFLDRSDIKTLIEELVSEQKNAQTNERR